MNVRISKFSAKGSVVAPPSKSLAHRLLIAAALKNGRSVIKNVGFSADVTSTFDCLTALGAKITVENGNAEVYGIQNLVGEDLSGKEIFVLNAGESGSTLRFLMPVVAAFGIRAEDLPRVCEKGYTGYNGHANQKSTGIGLYLCSTILKKLGHSFTITSQEGTGTRVTIGFPEES